MARLIFRAGTIVEVLFEEEILSDVWFPATVVEDLGNNLFLVEYNCSGINGKSKLNRVTVDHLHIRPSTPQIRVLNFSLLEKVDAFVDFGWWSGVVTKKLADSRYLVYFKHTNKVKELSHLELRPHVEWKNDKWFTSYQVPVSSDVDVEHDELRKNVSLNFTNMTEDTTCIDKQISIVTPSMKRAKSTNLGSKLKPSKKSNPRITSDDLSPSNAGQNEEVSNLTHGQTYDKDENLCIENKKLSKQKKSGELKHPMIISASKKGRRLIDTGSPKTLPQAAGDSTLETTPNIDENKHISKIHPIPVIMGLQCYAMTVSQSKKSKELTTNSSQNLVEPGAPQSDVQLALKATDNLERNEMDVDTVARKKRGRPFKTQSKNGKTSLAENHQNGDASIKKMPNTSGIELSMQLEEYNKPAKGKRGKRRMISINATSTPQEVQDSSKQKDGGNSEIIAAEKSLDTVSDDQPLSRWLTLAPLESTGKKQSEKSKSLIDVTNGDGQTLTFEKRSALWETIESMEAFRLIPQNPHFRPLDNIKESARERHAINKMVDFSGVFEETRRLRIDHPRTEIEDQLETLLELESHGFDINFLRNRLMDLISLKDKQEGLEYRSKEVNDNLQIHRIEAEELDKEIKSIDKQVKDLLEKRDCVSKEKDKKDSVIAGLEAEIDVIEEGMREYSCRADELVTASFV